MNVNVSERFWAPDSRKHGQVLGVRGVPLDSYEEELDGLLGPAGARHTLGQKLALLAFGLAALATAVGVEWCPRCLRRLHCVLLGDPLDPLAFSTFFARRPTTRRLTK